MKRDSRSCRSERASGSPPLKARSLMAPRFGCSTFHSAHQAVFFGLLNDLFPSIDPPRLVNDNLNSCVREVCEDMNLWPDDAFVLKVSIG